MICGHGHEQKFRYPYPRNSKKIQMPYPRAKTIDQNPALRPASPPLPAGLTLIGALVSKDEIFSKRRSPTTVLFKTTLAQQGCIPQDLHEKDTRRLF